MTESKGIGKDVLIFLLFCFTLLATVGVLLIRNAREQHRKQTAATESTESRRFDVESAGTTECWLSKGEEFHFPSYSLPQEQRRDFWWTPPGSDYLYINELRALYRISISSGQVERLPSIPEHRYENVLGSDAEIYLMRRDTANNRSRLLADIYSVADGQVNATRTLTDRPRLSGPVTKRKIWSPSLNMLALTMSEVGDSESAKLRTEFIDVHTGQPIAIPNEQDTNKSLDQYLAVSFSSDCSRLFLLRYELTQANAPGNISEPIASFDFDDATIRKFGHSDLPTRIPRQISDDGRYAAYVDRKNVNQASVEVWDTQTGSKTVSLEINSISAIKIAMVANGQAIGIADNRTLKLYSMADGSRLSRFPDQPPSKQRPMTPLFLAARGSSLIFCGIFSSQNEKVPIPWLHRTTVSVPTLAGTRSPHGQSPIGAGNLGAVDRNWTAWMSSTEYGKTFHKMAAQGKSPITVVGRLNKGEYQFRGRFFEPSGGLEVKSIHNAKDDLVRRKASQHRRDGFYEVWRQWFEDRDGIRRYSLVWTNQRSLAGTP